jgi:ABC-2 type transport system permease protein
VSYTIVTTAEQQPTSAEQRFGGPLTTLRIGLSRGRLELTQFAQDRAAVILFVLFPVVMLVLFASIFKGTEGGVPVKEIYTAGFIAVGTVSTSFQILALQVAGERHNGTLKRLRGTPMPKPSYFIGKIILVLVLSLVQVGVLLGVGALFFGVSAPHSPMRWLTLAWVFLLGVAGCTLLGIAYSSLVAPSTGGILVVLPVIALQFISGVFIPFNQLPRGIQEVAAVFPLKWIAQGMRSVFLPDSFTALEPAGQWEHGKTALILGAWAVAALVLCLTTFKWRDRGDG